MSDKMCASDGKAAQAMARCRIEEMSKAKEEKTEEYRQLLKAMSKAKDVKGDGRIKEKTEPEEYRQLVKQYIKEMKTKKKAKK